MEETFHSATNVSLAQFHTFLSFLLWESTTKLSVWAPISKLERDLNGMWSTMVILRLAIIIRLTFLIRLFMIPIIGMLHPSHKTSH